MGIGCGIYDAPGDDEAPLDISGAGAVFIPRVGVELAHHIRLTGSFTLIRKGFNSFNFTVGFVLGGRPKKK